MKETLKSMKRVTVLVDQMYALSYCSAPRLPAAGLSATMLFTMMAMGSLSETGSPKKHFHL